MLVPRRMDAIGDVVVGRKRCSAWPGNALFVGARTVTRTRTKLPLYVGRGEHSRTLSGEPLCKKHVSAGKTLWRADKGALWEVAVGVHAAQHNTAQRSTP